MLFIGIQPDMVSTDPLGGFTISIRSNMSRLFCPARLISSDRLIKLSFELLPKERSESEVRKVEEEIDSAGGPPRL